MTNETTKGTPKAESLPTPPNDGSSVMLPATAASGQSNLLAVIGEARQRGVPISTLFLVNDQLRSAAQALAQSMSRANGVVPVHLIGKPDACFAVMSKALNWGLDAYEVASATYCTPNGSIGYFGRLVHAVMASHPKIERIKFEDIGDWSKVAGKFEKRQSKRTDADGKPIFYMAEAWSREDEIGLGVRVWAQFKDGTEGEKLEVWLIECNPRNATTWPTRPRLQIRNVAVRAYANMVDPALLMGARFDDDDAELAEAHYGPDNAKDITPAEEVASQDKPSDGGKSKLEAFAAKHGNGKPAAAKAAAPEADHDAGSDSPEDHGAVTDGAHDQADGADAADGAATERAARDVRDIKVNVMLPGGKRGPELIIDQAIQWMEQQSLIASMSPEKWEALVEANKAWITGLSDVEANVVRQLYQTSRKDLFDATKKSR